MEVLNGLGNLIGPLIGSFLYTFGGYRAPFYGAAILYTSILLFYRFVIGNFSTENDENEMAEGAYESVIEKNKLSLK